MIIIAIILWYLIGSVGSLIIKHKYVDNEITITDIIIFGTIGGLLGLVWFIVMICISDIGNKKLF